MDSKRVPRAAPPILFYQYRASATPPFPSLPEDLPFSQWMPSRTPFCPVRQANPRCLVWTAFHFCHLFQSRDFTLQVVLDGKGGVLHRASLFPAFFRFPFMATEDLQVGDVWTSPEWRTNGIAAWSIKSLAHLYFPSRTVWYLTEADNLASIRTAQRAGFQLVAHGERVPHDGRALRARYRIVNWD